MSLLSPSYFSSYASPRSPKEGDPNFGPDQVAERPKLIYSPTIKQWVVGALSLILNVGCD